MDSNTNIRELKGIGDKTAELFNKIGINNLNDLITYYPRSYDKFETISKLSDVVSNERFAIYAQVKTQPKLMRYNGKSIISLWINDGENVCEVRYYNSPYIMKMFKSGDKKVFRGYIKYKNDRIYMYQPNIYSYEEYKLLENKIFPVYPLIKNLGNEKIKSTVKQALSILNKDSEYLSRKELEELNFSDYGSALYNIHFPSDEIEQYKARRRIIFEEFLSFIDISNNKEAQNKIDNTYPMIPVAECSRLMDSLPYELTNAQKRTINEIFNDMESEYVMNRVVQGDVGSGKTIVAILALIKASANGYQGAMMAPTEVLAKQHYDNIKNMAEKYHININPVYLAGKMNVKDRRYVLDKIKTGEANIIIGTHAIFQEDVIYKNLSLVITDEQHRFGVKQRELLKSKGNEPHILVMSATPIPRTLAMVIFGGQSVSLIDELPKSRIPVSNCVVDSSFRKKIYDKILSEINLGHQAYIICPMVSENEDNDLNLKSVEEYSQEIKEHFGDGISVASLNGKMKSVDKERIMEDFKNRKYDILVATTVIEVGIDVPNATIILIENAERFGLSTLHQLRGRVGRGNFPSFCILLSDSKKEQTIKRLKILNETNDGFKIAEEDMRLRGPGELNGVRQSGELSFGLGDIVNDSDIMMLAISKYERLKERLKTIKSNPIDFRTI